MCIQLRSPSLRFPPCLCFVAQTQPWADIQRHSEREGRRGERGVPLSVGSCTPGQWPTPLISLKNVGHLLAPQTSQYRWHHPAPNLYRCMRKRKKPLVFFSLLGTPYVASEDFALSIHSKREHHTNKSKVFLSVMLLNNNPKVEIMYSVCKIYSL